jgi:hypothetical protein
MRVGSQVCVAIRDPLDHEAIAEVAATTGCDVIVSIAPKAAIAAVLSSLSRPGRAPGQAPLPADLGGAATPAEAPTVDVEAAEQRRLSAEGAAAFKETIQQSPLPVEDKIRVYEALHAMARARHKGGPEAEREARRRAFAGLTPAAMKLALQLCHQVGARDVPVLKDEEFLPKRGSVGRFFESDRRFIVDRRAYERTVREHARKYKLDPVQIDNAVMAARSYVATRGQKQILLISEGEKALAEALSKIIRITYTRENPPPDASPEAYDGPERRQADADVQARIDEALADCGLDDPRRDKAVRAFRVIHRHLRGTFDRGKLKALIREGVFVGFGKPEIALVERLLRIQGYDLS